MLQRRFTCLQAQTTDGRIMRCGISRHFRDCKALLDDRLTRVWSAMASTGSLPI